MQCLNKKCGVVFLILSAISISFHTSHAQIDWAGDIKRLKDWGADPGNLELLKRVGEHNENIRIIEDGIYEKVIKEGGDVQKMLNPQNYSLSQGRVTDFPPNAPRFQDAERRFMQSKRQLKIIQELNNEYFPSFNSPAMSVSAKPKPSLWEKLFKLPPKSMAMRPSPSALGEAIKKIGTRLPRAVITNAVPIIEIPITATNICNNFFQKINEVGQSIGNELGFLASRTEQLQREQKELQDMEDLMLFAHFQENKTVMLSDMDPSLLDKIRHYDPNFRRIVKNLQSDAETVSSSSSSLDMYDYVDARELIKNLAFEQQEIRNAIEASKNAIESMQENIASFEKYLNNLKTLPAARICQEGFQAIDAWLKKINL